MAAPKATLEEMAEACQDEADSARWKLKNYYAQNPNSPPWPSLERDVLVWNSAAQILRTMGTYEDESRRFVAGLLKRHADGR